eukprot:NODE_889_length_2269_cov_38.686393_g756_i0.p1 GENE.NODE_889_length_2269_cov_38.686393_g756_i0~~NODE_889_length_2269_cov_38.686393_g756_i0.p1  ORF type:complete len:555 (-),score=89.08 NODE_889_length_2269_cov_38.686393_g756_i0:505-2169(-)
MHIIMILIVFWVPYGIKCEWTEWKVGGCNSSAYPDNWPCGPIAGNYRETGLCGRNNLNNLHKCECASNLMGPSCNTPIDPCLNNPCQVSSRFNGTCTNIGCSYRCECEWPWTGPECSEILVDRAISKSMDVPSCPFGTYLNGNYCTVCMSASDQIQSISISLHNDIRKRETFRTQMGWMSALQKEWDTDTGAKWMKELIWSDNLANMAKVSLTSCTKRPDRAINEWYNGKSGTVARNYYTLRELEFNEISSNPEDIIQNITKLWDSEKNWYGMDGSCKSPDDRTCKNYMNMVWANTRYFGCGIKWCNSKEDNYVGWIYICQYAPVYTSTVLFPNYSPSISPTTTTPPSTSNSSSSPSPTTNSNQSTGYVWFAVFAIPIAIAVLLCVAFAAMRLNCNAVGTDFSLCSCHRRRPRPPTALGNPVNGVYSVVIHDTLNHTLTSAAVRPATRPSNVSEESQQFSSLGVPPSPPLPDIPSSSIAHFMHGRGSEPVLASIPFGTPTSYNQNITTSILPTPSIHHYFSPSSDGDDGRNDLFPVTDNIRNEPVGHQALFPDS